MIGIVFVGDTASSKNVNCNIPFVGTKSLTTLINWIKYLHPDYYVCYNSDCSEYLTHVKVLKNAGFKVVALGTKAAERLNKVNIIHFQLPHPSGRNRLLNDKEYMNRELKVCYNYIHDKLEAIIND